MYIDGQFTDSELFNRFKFGYGIFETILYNGERVCNVERHLNRLIRSSAELGIAVEHPDYRVVISELLDHHNLHGVRARINIFLAGYPDTSIIVTATPYLPPELPSVALSVCPDVHLSHLCRHKTMNYMHYLHARKNAVHDGAYDALLTDGVNILETTTASLLLVQGDKLITPKSSYLLPGTALAAVESMHAVEHRVIPLDTLREYDHVYLVNTLIGLVPVEKVGTVGFAVDAEKVEKLSRLICE